MQRDAVITIHGIKWKEAKDWQNRMGVYLKSQDNFIKVFHFRYGRILGVYSWMIRAADRFHFPLWFRNRYEKKLIKFIQQLQKQFPVYRFSIIAHSFGGHITEAAINRQPDMKLKNIIFMHCPISAHIENGSYWNLLETEKLNAVFAWSSHKDVVIGKIAIKPFGQNGYWGFIRYGQDNDRALPKTQPYPINLYNTHTEEDHSGVLNKLDQYGPKLLDQVLFNNPPSQTP